MTEFDEYRSWKGWVEGSFAKFNPIQSLYFESELQAAGIDIRHPLKILEIGFGDGSFSAWAVFKGFEYAGTEIDPELLIKAKSAGYKVFHPTEGLRLSSFDVIVAFDVLEHMHLDDIISFLHSAKEALNPGGRLIARFPSGDSPFGRAIQHGDITHQTTIGSGMVEQLCIRTGFNIIQIRSPIFPIFGIGLARAIRRGIVLIIRTVVEWILRITYFDNMPRVLSATMVIVLEKPSGNP